MLLIRARNYHQYAINQRIFRSGLQREWSKASQFASGVSALPSAVDQLSDGTSALNKGLQTLGTAIGSRESENTLIYASNAVTQGVSGIKTALSEQISPAVSNLSTGITSAKSTEDQITALLTAADQKLAEGDTDAAKTSIAAAMEMSKGVSTGLGTISQGADALDTGVAKLSDNMTALSTGTSKLTSGLESVGSGITNLQAGASKLASGTGAFSDKSSSLVSGADKLSDATGQLNDGVSTLSDNVSSMVDGIAEQITGEQTSEDSTSANSGAAIQAVINQGSNVTVSSVVESLITKIFAQAGLDFEIDYINPVSAGFNATYFGTCVFIFVYIVSYATGVLLTRNQPLQNLEKRNKTKPALIQLVYALGLTIPILMLVLGIGTANMPYEFLPEIWQNWIYPWMSLQIISNGIKNMLCIAALKRLLHTWRICNIVLLEKCSRRSYAVS